MEAVVVRSRSETENAMASVARRSGSSHRLKQLTIINTGYLRGSEEAKGEEEEEEEAGNEINDRREQLLENVWFVSWHCCASACRKSRRCKVPFAAALVKKITNEWTACPVIIHLISASNGSGATRGGKKTAAKKQIDVGEVPLLERNCITNSFIHCHGDLRGVLTADRQ